MTMQLTHGVLGHLFLRLLIRWHSSYICLLLTTIFACALRYAHLFARSHHCAHLFAHSLTLELMRFVYDMNESISYSFNAMTRYQGRDKGGTPPYDMGDPGPRSQGGPRRIGKKIGTREKRRKGKEKKRTKEEKKQEKEKKNKKN